MEEIIRLNEEIKGRPPDRLRQEPERTQNTTDKETES